MSLVFVGTTFGPNSQWHIDEINLIKNLSAQIERAFPTAKNLLVNTTWFGPQYNNGQYEKFVEVTSQTQFDNLFFLASVDPVYLDKQILTAIVGKIKNIYYLGNFDDGYSFNFISTLLPKYFKQYTDSELLLEQVDHVYLSYNRKPRQHRVELCQKLVDANLIDCGVVTLGRNDKIYSMDDNSSLHFLLGENPEDYAGAGNWNMDMELGIPHDIHSLGNMNIWRRHFLSVIGETEFKNNKSVFVTEKTWKPILGLRPFVINGQNKLYSWLRQRGFKTFEKYWPTIQCENLPDYQICDHVVFVIDTLQKLPRHKLIEMYNDMMPDLLYNRDRFYNFVKEQEYKIDHVFDPVDNK